MSVFTYFSLSSSDLDRILSHAPDNASVSSTPSSDGRYDVTITLSEIIYPDPATLDIV